MATADSMVKLVQKQAGRAKEKVSASKIHPKIALYSWQRLSSHLAFWHGLSWLSLAQCSALTLD